MTIRSQGHNLEQENSKPTLFVAFQVKERNSQNQENTFYEIINGGFQETFIPSLNTIKFAIDQLSIALKIHSLLIQFCLS